MKKIKIVNHKNNRSFGAEIDNPTEWINDCISNNSWGKPERWVLVDSESYEQSDVLETEERSFSYVDYELNELGHTVEVTKERVKTWVKLRAEYTVEVVDLESDYDWLLSEVHKSRVAEYPPLTELADALYWKERGDDSKYEKYIQKCDEVKKKYPLPIKGSN